MRFLGLGNLPETTQLASLVAQMVKNVLQCRRPRFSPCVGRCPGGGNSNLLQYSYLENSTHRGAWWAVAHSVAKESDTTERVTHS